MFDKVTIQDKIGELAEKYLRENLSETDFKIFSTEVKRTIDNAFDASIFKEEKRNANLLNDADHKRKFTDIQNGYVSVMRAWLKTNPVELEEVEIPIGEKEFAKKYGLTTLGAGTFLAVLIAIWSNNYLALATEVVTLVAAYKMYKKGQQKDLDVLKKKFEKAKESYIIRVKKDACEWLRKAEDRSNEILKSYSISQR